MRHDGKSIHRLADNPMERRFNEAWKREQKHGHILEYLMGDGTSRAEVSERDELVAATVIQWLGSPVGSHFLQTVLKA